MQQPADSYAREIPLLALAAFSSAIALRVCDPLLPKLATDFQVTPGQAAHVIAYFSVAYGLLQVCFGPLGDRYGKFRVITYATLACSIGSLGAVLSNSLDALVASRIVAGATGAAIIPQSMAWIGDHIPYERRQATLARFLMGQIMGIVGGQLLGGFFADTLGWRWAFVMMTALYIGVGLLLLGELRRNRGIDTVSVSQTTPTGTGSKPPPLWRQFQIVLGARWARYVLIAVFLEGFLVFGAFAFVPTYLHLQFSVSLTGAGAIFSVYGLGGLAYTVVTKRLVASFGERGLAAGGGALLCAAFLLLLFGATWAWAIPASFIAGFGFYMLHNTLQTNATQMAPDARGTAVSSFASCFFTGQAVGVAGAAYIVDHASTAWVFGIAALTVPLIGAWFAYALRFRPA
jgi:predicted MFS family arabinose efflux permease